ncbi:MAG: cytochrome c3 family protein [Vicinamibacterales bacterium]
MRPVCLGLLLGVWLLTPPVAAAQDPPQLTSEDCLACHADETLTRANGTPVTVSADTLGASIHGFLGCTDCHADLAANPELPHAETLAKVDCATCHDEPASTLAASVHHPRPGGEEQTPTCTSCHGTHDIRPSSDPASRTYPLNLPTTCATCHGGQHLVGPRGEVADSYEDSVHGRAIARSGLLVAANCGSCHGSHGILPASDPASRVNRANIAKTCATCHEGIDHVYETSIHGSQVASGNTAAAVCSDCHTSHRIQRSDVEAWRLAVIDECGTCHVERIATYRDTYHGKVTELGYTRVAACADCHGSHQILPASNPASMVSPERVVSTCQTCHPGANANFAKYDPHADKTDPERSPALYWASRFMQLLLAGVFLFFGAHTLLWFPRSLKARRERRRPTPGAGDAR